MNYWWVNHKQTHLAEISGGYIWSPKNNANGGNNQTYLNLTLVNPGDFVFSYADGMIKAIGVASNRHREKPQPSEFGVIGEKWSKTGWEVPIEWELLQSPIRPKDHIHIIAPLLPKVYSPIRENGHGNQSCYLASISEELGQQLIAIVKSKDAGAVYAALTESGERQEHDIEIIINQEGLTHTEKEQLIKSRVGQGLFRINLEKIEKGCRVTGVTRKDLLIASHIKPWKVSSNEERLDGWNGLLLAPHVDKLFDRGWISFTNEGDILAAEDAIIEILKLWGIDHGKNVGRFSLQQCRYLGYHREHVFLKGHNHL
jgi:putative restriction endonuclease